MNNILLLLYILFKQTHRVIEVEVVVILGDGHPVVHTDVRGTGQYEVQFGFSEQLQIFR